MAIKAKNTYAEKKKKIHCKGEPGSLDTVHVFMCECPTSHTPVRAAQCPDFGPHAGSEAPGSKG